MTVDLDESRAFYRRFRVGNYLRAARHATRPLKTANLRTLMARALPEWTPTHVMPALSRAAELVADGRIDAALQTLSQPSGHDVEMHIAAAGIARRSGLRDEEVRSLEGAAAATRALQLAGSECVRSGRPRLALGFLTRAAVALPFIQTDHSRGTSVVLSDLALAFQDLSDWKTADAIYRSALEACPPTRPELQVQHAVVLSNLGTLRLGQGLYDEALDDLTRSLKIMDRIGHAGPSDLMATLVNLAQAESIRGNVDIARALLSRAESIGSSAAGVPATAYASACLHLADLDIEAGDEAAANRNWRRARRAARRAGSRRLEAEGWSANADRLAKAGHLSSARRYLLRALRLLSREGEDVEQRVEILHLLADVAREQRDLRHAATFARRALEEGTAAFGDEWVGNADSLKARGRIEWDRADYVACSATRSETVRLLAKLFDRFHPKRLVLEGELAEALMAKGSARKAIRVLITCIRSEAALLERLLDRRSGILEAGQLRFTRDHLELLLVFLFEGRKARRAHLAELFEIVIGYRGLASEIRRRKLRGGASELEQDAEGTVSIVLSETYRHLGTARRVLLVRHAGRVSAVHLGEALAFEKDMNAWTRDRGLVETEGATRIASVILAATAGATCMVWLPDAGLARHPISALPIGRGRRLVDHLAILQPRDAHVLRQGRHRKNAPRGIMLVGVSTFKSDLKPLPGVTEEIDRLRDEHRSKDMLLLRDAEATRDRVVDGLLGLPRLVHIATHGISMDPKADTSSIRARMAAEAFGDPLAGTALVLPGAQERNDDLLTARDIVALDLVGIDTVVIAACDSGVAAAHASEGMLGMQAALHAAGVETVITSLWPLTDHSSPAFAVLLHSELASGQPPYKALNRAQLRLQAVWPTPDHWGGWIVSGPLAS